MQKSDCIIGVEHVSKFFGDKAVLNDVNLSVRKGEFVTILGPSGCGKTTLLRLIAGFQTASEGVITIAGKDITQTPPHRRPVNTVFQKYALFPHLNVFNNIAFGLKLKKLPAATIEKKVKQALRMVGMTDYEDRDVDSLSGGQQQRVAIARAIVNEPEAVTFPIKRQTGLSISNIFPIVFPPCLFLRNHRFVFLCRKRGCHPGVLLKDPPEHPDRLLLPL